MIDLLSIPPRRIVTGHLPNGSATVLYEGNGKVREITSPGEAESAKFAVLWQEKQPTNNVSPVEDLAEVDVSIARGDGSVCRVVDMPPHHSSQMHRTVSLDYGIVLAGNLELELETIDGPNEFRKLQVGDVVVQRGTNHAWHNRGDTWGRMVYVLLGAEKITLNGKTIEPVAHNISGGKLAD